MNTHLPSYERLDRTPDEMPIYGWTRGVAVEEEAVRQLANVAQLPFIHDHIAVMPDVHFGIGATVGSVIPTRGAIVPAAVGVDIGCGMIARKTSLRASQLPDNLFAIRSTIEARVPHGRTDGGRRNDRGAFRNPPDANREAWAPLDDRYAAILAKHPQVSTASRLEQLGTLGTGNHFIEICLDESDAVWVMLHSGSRGIGNRIGTYFIERAKKDLEAQWGNLPHRDLAYFTEHSTHFNDYIEAVSWAQDYARANRELMITATLRALKDAGLPKFTVDEEAINCHHNYVAKEHHFGADVFVTRKGAVRAGEGELGIIPGSMGARSYIVRGRGNADSFCSCSHGAGRAMSRTAAQKRFTLKDHRKATAGIECRKDRDVIDETPMAYKPIDKVMAAQADLVAIVHELRQVICVKG
jgi:tRNA-splicing ligase RtcB